jgi:RNA polymerase sigma-70 factor (ECF subfamily)
VELVIDDKGLAAMVASAATGDEIAFARIVAAHHDDMARVAFVICGDTDLAQEAVQAAWPHVWRKMHTIRDPQRLRPWLVSIAANEAKQLLRRRSRRAVREIRIDDDVEGISSIRSADPAARSAEIDLANVLARLDPRDRTVIALRYAAGLTSAEIGEAIGMSAPGVRARLARVLVRLRKDLADE